MFTKFSSSFSKFLLVALLLVALFANFEEAGYSQRSLFNCDPDFDILKGDDPRECLPGFTMSDTRAIYSTGISIRDYFTNNIIERASSGDGIYYTQTDFNVAVISFAPNKYQPILLVEVLGTSYGIHFEGYKVNVYDLSGVHPPEIDRALGIELGTAIVEKRFSPVRGSKMYFAWVDKNLDQDVDPGELSDFKWVVHKG